ncbi:MAG: ABC transporter ATP-binding protein, partial [Oscillospiraceae bacterium]|nr:ABC transporter ATP-binding protein [Oscillospiraceae bacterium]
LDAKLRNSMRTEITKLHKKLGTTFIYVTHDQTEAMTMGDRIVVMKDGVIQQTDTPQNLYNYPTNLFVAGFIGAPQMNFTDGTLVEKDGKLVIDVEGNYTVEVPAEKAENSNLRDYIGKTVVFGVRPEDIKISELENYAGATTKANVDLTELMGSETYVYLDCFGKKLICRAAPDLYIKEDTEIEIGFNTKKLHIFDKETKSAICH